MIPIVERVLFLKSIELFEDIPGELLVAVARLAEEQSFDEGEVLIERGDEGDCLFLVVEGEASVRLAEREVARAGRGECIGEMSLLDAEPRSATVVACGAVRTLRVDQEPFFELLTEHTELTRGLIAMLSRRLRTMLREHTRRTIV